MLLLVEFLTNCCIFFIACRVRNYRQNFHTKVGQRIFNVKVEEKVFENIDIIALAGTHGKAMTLETAQVCVNRAMCPCFCDVLDL
jgi:Malectin domain